MSKAKVVAPAVSKAVALIAALAKEYHFDVSSVTPDVLADCEIASTQKGNTKMSIRNLLIDANIISYSAYIKTALTSELIGKWIFKAFAYEIHGFENPAVKAPCLAIADKYGKVIVADLAEQSFGQGEVK